jgi:hypothetical protein
MKTKTSFLSVRTLKIIYTSILPGLKCERPPTYAEAVPEADPGEWSRLQPQKEHLEQDGRVVIIAGQSNLENTLVS